MDPIVWAAIVAAGPATLGVFVSLFNGRRAKRIEQHASEINDSVNHRHPNEPRLLDLVRSGVELTTMNSSKIDHLSRRFDEHLEQHRHGE